MAMKEQIGPRQGKISIWALYCTCTSDFNCWSLSYLYKKNRVLFFFYKVYFKNRISFWKICWGGGQNVNLTNFDGVTYRIIVVCILANKFQRGCKTIARGSDWHPRPLNETLRTYNTKKVWAPEKYSSPWPAHL